MNLPPLPKPGEAYVLTEEEDERERRCQHYKTCACYHTACRDGWLDEEVPEPRRGQPGRTVVKACPYCKDAALMAAELKTPKHRTGTR